MPYNRELSFTGNQNGDQVLKRTNTAVKKNLGLGLDVAADDDACPILAGYWHELKVGAGVSISVQKPYSRLPKDIPSPKRYAKMYFSHTPFSALFLPFCIYFSLLSTNSPLSFVFPHLSSFLSTFSSLFITPFHIFPPKCHSTDIFPGGGSEGGYFQIDNLRSGSHGRGRTEN